MGAYCLRLGVAPPMDLAFDSGNADRPVGHALVYFRVDTEPDRPYASYVVTLPIKSDLTKYVPPFLAAHLGSLPLSDLSAFAMPPVPEPVNGYAELQRLARQRGDDLVYAGNLFSFDLPRLMESVADAVKAYSELCVASGATAATPGDAEPVAAGLPEGEGAGGGDEDDAGFSVNEVLFSFMSEGDKLNELSRLMGRLTFAVEGQDAAAIDEVEQEMRVLARHLPEDFRVRELLAAAKDPSERSAELARLYLDRCFRLSAGAAAEAAELEQRIRDLQQG